MRSRTAKTLLVAALSWSWSACGSEDLVAPDPGEIRITTSTGGTEPDPDGYLVSIDGVGATRIGTDVSITLSATPGEHVVELSDVAPACAIAGEARRVVVVEPGATVEVVFALLCGPTTGGLIVTTATTGPLADPDGYTVALDGGVPQPIGSNASLSFLDLAPGAHQVELGGVADNCTLDGANPVTVEIAVGEPAAVTFRVVCAAGVERWTPMITGSTADFTNVWAEGSAVFVMGERDVRRGVEGVILTYDGAAWVPQFREEDLRPRALWGSSPQDVYAVGYGFLSGLARILHFDGSQWTTVPEFDQLGLENAGFESVWGSSATDIFAVGFDFEGPFNAALIYHYGGTGWTRMTVADGGSGQVLNDVWGASGTDVYAVGRDQIADPSAGIVLHYDGVAWTRVLEIERLTLNAVWGSSATDVFAGGFQVEERGEDFIVSGAIWHFDGSTWTAMPLPEAGVVNEIWGSSGSDVYAVGSDGLILHYDGAAWTAVTPTTASLLGVWGGVPGQVFAVGTEGTILLGTPE